MSFHDIKDQMFRKQMLRHSHIWHRYELSQES